MEPLKTRELLNQLLAGNELEDEEFEEMLHMKEDLYLDFKDGIITSREKIKEGRHIIRRWVSGFANADGGVLVVGVKDKLGKGARKRRLSLCHQIGEQSLDSWARDVLKDMMPFMSPVPRFQVYKHKKGEVLIIATTRAPQPVPCRTGDKIKYYFRFHDSTPEAPEYLISDLVLGRRQHPIMSISESNSSVVRDKDVANITLNLKVENNGLVVAEDVVVGIISFSGERKDSRINKHLMSYIETMAPVVRVWSSGLNVTHLQSSRATSNLIDILPFTSWTFSVGAIKLPVLEPVTIIDASIAVYVLPRNHPPIWYQIEFQLSYEYDGDGETCDIDIHPIKQVAGIRPVVAVEYVDGP